MLRITDILDKMQSYLTVQEMELLEKAYIFSASVHQGQLRLSGEPYLTHPVEVTGILADMKLDAPSLATGLLHDTVEDTLTTIEEIESNFGKEVAFLVDGLTKISKITLGDREERQAENFRKMILAMSSDIRILLIRLADRIHNMRTLEFHIPERREYIAKETLELYAPLANRLGIDWMKVELEDMAFRYIDPDQYNLLARNVAQSKEKRENYTKEVKTIIQDAMDKFGISAEVEGRAKHFYSIFQKMQKQHINFSEVYDLIAFRIILDSDKDRDCYEALSIVHALWKPIPGRFKDYVAMPKANNYRSLHTTVMGPHGQRVEIQIRTREMHAWAEEGIAAHWRYKEKLADKTKEGEQIQKLRELLELHQDLQNPHEFMSNLKLALFPDEVYVFTPKGDVKSFPKGATPIDFAYSIHTDVGHQCVGAKVNQNIVPLKYELQNGDIVEIITQAGHRPSKDWLKYSVTSKARAKIKNWVSAQEEEKSINLGRDILEREFQRQHLKFSQILKSNDIKKVYEEYGISSPEELMGIVGYGKVSAKRIVKYFLPEAEAKIEDTTTEKKGRQEIVPTTTGISLTGIEDVLVRFAKCCDPIPGDDIVGFVSRGRGINIHVADCPNVEGMDAERLVNVTWNIKEKHTYPVNMRVRCIDKKGILAEISAVISSLDVNINHAEINTEPHIEAVCDFVIDVHDLKQFNQVVAAIKKLDTVTSIKRIRKA